MRSVNLQDLYKNGSSWVLATLLTHKYLLKHRKSNELFDQLPSNLCYEKKSRIKNLFYGVLRNQSRISDALKPITKKTPKNLLLSILFTSGYELIESNNNKKEKIIHHAVEESKRLVSPSEVKFLNAILRRLPSQLASQSESKSLSIFYSHPEWLVENWVTAHGHDATKALLKWNQLIPSIYLYNRAMPNELEGKLMAMGNHFYRLANSNLNDPEIKALLENGSTYIKDPATSHSVTALNPKEGEKILDLCAAPGGKTFDCIQRMNHKGMIVAVDLPGKRMDRLNENLQQYKNENLLLEFLACDVCSLSESFLEKQQLPTQYDAVLLDAPCSNTGVIQRKPDVRWRLQKKDLEQCVDLQLKLLKSASKRVRAGGRIVYSTCSIESVENDFVIKQFLESESGNGFTLTHSNAYYPWIHKHDGAGVFLMSKAKT